MTVKKLIEKLKQYPDDIDVALIESWQGQRHQARWEGVSVSQRTTDKYGMLGLYKDPSQPKEVVVIG